MGEKCSWRASVNFIRLHVTGEGQTEQAFVKDLLADYLSQFHVFTDARCVLTSKDNKAAREYRGGLINYQKARQDIVSWMKEDNHPECRFTTMFDLYALPDDFPGYQDAQRQTNPYVKTRILEEAMAKDINDWRFIPYLQLHEFEAFIFADPKKLNWEYLEHDEPIAKLVAIALSQDPELINEGPETAPSKRILTHIPEYDKVVGGGMTVQKIGLETLRVKCPHFDAWVRSLESLTNATNKNLNETLWRF
ncbi:MAG: DUF4276 family protein [Magnetococcales bacterium]|nr:DUF4276 family protein [Magnetococcales bacterium]